MKKKRINLPEDKVQYAVICEKFPIPRMYFGTYSSAVSWIKIEQPADRPHYIVKCIEHYEFCDNENNK